MLECCHQPLTMTQVKTKKEKEKKKEEESIEEHEKTLKKKKIEERKWHRWFLDQINTDFKTLKFFIAKTTLYIYIYINFYRDL